MELGMTYEGAGLNELAEQTYAQYVELFPGQVIGWYRLAVVRHNQGKMKEAIIALEKAAEIAPARMDAPHWQLAFWYIDVGDIVKAKVQIDIADVKQPNTMQVLIAKGRIALEENKPLVAIDLLNNEKLIREVPDGYVYQLLGRAYRVMGDQERSRAAWAKAGQKKPNWADPWTRNVVNHVVGLNALRQEIMKNMQANNLAKVRQLIDEYISYDNTNRVVRRIDASWHAKQGELALAVSKFNALMKEQASDTITAILLAKLRMKIVQFQTAEEIEVTQKMLENVLSITPDHVVAQQLLNELQR
jgi:tetratricopeptide (TPR) repeat protein